MRLVHRWQLPMRAASRRHSTKVLPESRIGDRDTLWILNHDAIFRRRGKNSESHCDAVIAVRVDRAREPSSSRANPQPLRQLVRLRPNVAIIALPRRPQQR